MKLMKTILLLSVLSASCSQIPKEWDRSEMDSFYNRKDYETVDKIIREKEEGYSNYSYFPLPTHLRIHQAIKTGNLRFYDDALVDLEKMKKRAIDSSPSAYIQLVRHLKSNGLEPTFQNRDGKGCAWNSQYLLEAHENAIFDKNLWNVEGAFWYSLFVNSECTNVASKAIYIDLLAELDASKARLELQKLLDADSTQTSFAFELNEELCGFRKKHTQYEESGLNELVTKKIVNCKEPYTGFWKD